MKTIGIILPTRNRPNELWDWMRAMSNRDLTDHPDEIIIINDSSTYDTVQMVMKNWNIGISYKTFTNSEQMGTVESSKVGLWNSTTDFVMFASDEVVILPGAIKSIRDAINSKSNPKLVLGRSRWIDDKRDIRWIASAKNPTGFNTAFDTGIDAASGYFRPAYETAVLDRQEALLLITPALKCYNETYMTWSLAFTHGYLMLPDILTGFMLREDGVYGGDKTGEQTALLMLKEFERNLNPGALLRLRNSGALGYLTHPSLNAVMKAYPLWVNGNLKSHRMNCKLETFFRKYLPAWVQKLGVKYY